MPPPLPAPLPARSPPPTLPHCSTHSLRHCPLLRSTTADARSSSSKALQDKMSVSMRRTKGLPSESDDDATNDTGRVLVAATPVQKTNDYLEDIPVASDDEGTVNGGRETVARDGETNDSQERQMVRTIAHIPDDRVVNDHAE